MAPTDADILLPDSPMRSDAISDGEVLAYELMEDERLRRICIDPDGDPIEIMLEIRRQYRKLKS